MCYFVLYTEFFLKKLLELSNIYIDLFVLGIARHLFKRKMFQFQHKKPEPLIESTDSESDDEVDDQEDDEKLSAVEEDNILCGTEDEIPSNQENDMQGAKQSSTPKKLASKKTEIIDFSTITDKLVRTWILEGFKHLRYECKDEVKTMRKTNKRKSREKSVETQQLTPSE